MLSSLLLLSLTAGATPAIETDSTAGNPIKMSEVVVSDFKRNKRNLTSTAVSGLEQAQLQQQNIGNLKELSAVMPNFFMPDYGSRANTPIFIRGIGAKAKGTAVGFYVDGLPHYEASAFDIDLSDVAKVEVFRGPQGTLYGRNAIGGIINVYTHNPLDYQHTRFKVGYGRFNDLVLQGSTYRKITGNFGISAGASYHHSDGMFKNATLQEKVDDIDESEGKLGLYWRPVRNWQLSLNSTLTYSDQGGYPYAPYDVANKVLSPISYNRYSSFRRLISSNGFNAKYENERISFNSQTSYQFIKTHLGIDQDFTPADKYFVVNEFHQNMLSQEFTLKSNNGSRYQWILGMFGMLYNTNQFVETTIYTANSATPTTYHQPISSFAVYHQSSYNIWKGLSATLGLRFDYEHAKLDYAKDKVDLGSGVATHQIDFSSKANFRQFTPKFTLQYLTTQRNLYYAGITRGYKAGGFNVSFTNDDERAYNPEYSWNYEVGTRLSFWDGILTAEADLFLIDWRHMQTTYTVAGLGNITKNAGHTRSKGLELTLAYHPVKSWAFSVSYGYTHAKYLDYKMSAKADYSGKYLPMVPGHTLALNGNYEITSISWLDKLTFNVNMNGLGRIYWADDNAVSQNFYAVLNANVAAKKGIFTLSLWGKNLTGTDYMAYGFKASNGNYAQQGKKLTFGTSLSVDF